EIAIPLPLRWLAHGRFRGLGVVAYPSAAPTAMTVLAPRQITVEAGQ
ncbi:MAG: hypothetical protein HUU15_06765, partial [Candidatus Brocadiae bacterium]|nr:hypothetical protein [Candidatus Brocadiia bacterium]